MRFTNRRIQFAYYRMVHFVRRSHVSMRRPRHLKESIVIKHKLCYFLEEIIRGEIILG